MVPLKRVSTVNDDTLSEDTDPELRISYVDIGNVSSDGRILGDTRYAFEKAPSRARRLVRHGDVIISTVRTYLKAIAPIIDPPDDLVVSTGFAVVRPDPLRLDPAFCKYALRTPTFLDEVVRRSTGVSYPAISASRLIEIPVSLPPLDEQRAIAADLDRETARLDALMDAKTRLLERLAARRQSLVTRAVTRGLDPEAPMKDSGVKWLGEVPAHWEVVRLRWMLTELGQGWSPSADDRPPSDDQWGVLKLSAVSGGHYLPQHAKTLPGDLDPREDLAVRPGDVIVTRANTPALVGEACYVEETPPHLMLSDLMYRLRTRAARLNGQFLAYVLRTPIGRYQIERDARGSSRSMVKISQSHIRDWLVPLPPLPEQEAIVNALARETASLDALAATTRQSIERLGDRRAALIAETVTGRRRVPV